MALRSGLSIAYDLAQGTFVQTASINFDVR
jgi:hypothetical protein